MDNHIQYVEAIPSNVTWSWIMRYLIDQAARRQRGRVQWWDICMYSTIKVHAASTFMCNRQARMHVSFSSTHTAVHLQAEYPRSNPGQFPPSLLNRHFQIHKRPRFPHDVMFLLIKENVQNWIVRTDQNYCETAASILVRSLIESWYVMSEYV